ncbi:MAG: protein kinase [Deltaproteobacteria bacterium]|nr:protein kinase [Deltaproteobacteria bacterium]
MRRGPETQVDDTLATGGRAFTTGATGIGLSLGQIVAQRYEIVELLGEGGMGAVYLVNDFELDERVALKALRSELSGSEDASRRFRSEVKLARRITHKNVARIFEFGSEGSLNYLTMELIEGRTLAAELREAGPFSPARAALVLSAIASGLQSVHDAGVVHRDIKPANVLIARDGRVVLTDFGIALLAKVRDATEGLVGTPDYMSPEQVQGLELTPKSDVYSLGVLAFELISGQRPFSGEGALQIALARLNQDPPELSSLYSLAPRELSEVIRQAMSLDPSDRPRSAQAFGDALLRASGVTSPITSSLSQPAPEPRPLGRALAVLKIKSAEGSEDLADGLREELVDSLSAVRGLRVLSPRAVDRLELAGTPADELGRGLGAALLLEGAMRGSPDAARVSLRLIEVEDDTVILSHRDEVTWSGLLAASDRIAAAVSRALSLEKKAERSGSEADAEAIELYLRGRTALVRYGPGAIELLEAALARSPDHPLFLAALASAKVRYSVRAPRSDPAVMRAARDCAERAIKRAPDLAEPQLALVHVLLHEGSLEAAVRGLRKTVALGPSNSEAHALLGELLVEVGRLTEGVRRLNTALTLEPGSVLAASALARAYALLGDWNRAYEVIRVAAVDVPGESPLWALAGRFGIWRGDRAGVAQLRNSLPNKSESMISVVTTLYANAFLEHRIGPEAAAIEAEVPSSARRASLTRQILAEVYAVAGEPERALRALEEANGFGLVDILWLDRCPLFGSLRSSPRFSRVRSDLARRSDLVVDALWG